MQTIDWTSRPRAISSGCKLNRSHDCAISTPSVRDRRTGLRLWGGNNNNRSCGLAETNFDRKPPTTLIRGTENSLWRWLNLMKNSVRNYSVNQRCRVSKCICSFTKILSRSFISRFYVNSARLWIILTFVCALRKIRYWIIWAEIGKLIAYRLMDSRELVIRFGKACGLNCWK